jgi:hypothetical protein
MVPAAPLVEVLRKDPRTVRQLAEDIASRLHKRPDNVQRQISRLYEGKTRRLHIDTVDQLCSALDLPMSYVYSGRYTDLDIEEWSA